jgi:hypothetical protein
MGQRRCGIATPVLCCKMPLRTLGGILTRQIRSLCPFDLFEVRAQCVSFFWLALPEAPR